MFQVPSPYLLRKQNGDEIQKLVSCLRCSSIPFPMPPFTVTCGPGSTRYTRRSWCRRRASWSRRNSSPRTRRCRSCSTSAVHFGSPPSSAARRYHRRKSLGQVCHRRTSADVRGPCSFERPTCICSS